MPGVRHVGAAFVCGILAASLARPARADDDRLRLRWSAPPGCPSADAVEKAALASLASAPGRASSVGALQADARIDRTARGFRLTLHTREGKSEGERQLDSTTCAAAADAAAVLLALALFPPEPGGGPAGAPPTALAWPSPPSLSGVPSPAAASPAAASAPGLEPPAFAAPSAPVAPVAPTPASAESPAPHEAAAGRRSSSSAPHAPFLAVGLGVAGDASTLPSPAVGAAASLSFTTGRLRVELGARRWASQSAALTTADAGARFTMTSAGLRSCWTVLRAGPFEGSPCVGADLAFVDAAGYGAQTNYAATARWFDAAVGALARMKLARWLALRATLEVVVPLSRPTFVVEGEGDVHRPPAVGGVASLGAEALIP